MKIEVFVTNLGKYNEGEMIGEWLELPTTQEEINEVLERIGVKDGTEYEEYFITDVSCDIKEIHESISEYVSVFDLNEKIEALQDYDDDLIQAVFESYSSDIEAVVEMVTSEDYIFYNGMSLIEVAEEIVEDCYDLPDFALRYFDYDALARDLMFDGYAETSTGVILYT